MTIAELHGKLEPHERREDLLTSDVFGTFKYLGVDHGLRQFLQLAINIEREKLSIPEDCDKAEFYFWPRMKDGTEPDLLIKLQNRRGKTILVMVEAKLRDPIRKYAKVSEGENEESDRWNVSDQLATEYENLKNCSLKQTIDFGHIIDKVLLYVTSDHSIPRQDLHESIAKLEEKGIPAKDKIFWVSWREIPLIIENNAEYWDGVTCSAHDMLDDLRRLLKRKNLVKFNGFVDLSDCRLPRLRDFVFHSDAVFKGFEGLERWRISYLGGNIFLEKR